LAKRKSYEAPHYAVISSILYKGRDHSEDVGVDERIILEWKVKVNVKLSPCLTKHHAMKTYWGSGGIAPRILDLGTRWR
jgi:hypothetical protein